MEQIHEQEGHFVLTVKKNQPEAYEEIHTFMDKLEAEAAKKKKGEIPEPVMREKGPERIFRVPHWYQTLFLPQRNWAA